jgi:hypothetical protein
MPITIKKPVKAEPPEKTPEKITLAVPEKNVPRPCRYCGHVYVTPCDGENLTCMNYLHLEAKA